MKKTMALLLTVVSFASLLASCTSQSSTSVAGTAGGSSQEGSSTAQGTGEKQIIEYWFHSANDVSNEFYEQVVADYNASQDLYEVVYTGIAFADFNDKFTMAVVTDTMPDVVSLGFSNVMAYVEMDALIDMLPLYEQWEDAQQINTALIDTALVLGDGALYGIPYAYNQEVSWYNTQLIAENGITLPETQDDFLSLCAEYADPASDKYFFSLRAVRPYDNLVGWLFTYTDGAGYNGSYFDENGVCILDNPAFAEAMDAYASLYWNNQVSGDSVNNNFDQIVAEFGSGTSMYIMHNSASLSSHEQNLGEGNFAAVKPLTNASGRYFTSALQPNIYSICNTQGLEGDYSGAMDVIEYLCSADVVSETARINGRVPANSESFNDAWVQESDLLQLCLDIVNDENFIQVQNPYWLSSFTNFIQETMTTDFQAVLLKEKTSEEVLAEWAAFLTAEQAAYLAG